MKKSLIAAILLLNTILALAAMADPDSPLGQGSLIEITDSTGKDISLSAVPQRIVSCAPSITEIIFALGRGDALVGRTDFCDYPAEAASVESIGSLKEPNIEKIISLNPDVVVVSTHFNPDHTVVLENLGIPVVSLYSDQSFQGTYGILETMGLLLGTTQTAEDLVASMKADIAEVEQIVSQTESRPRVYYVVGFGPYGDFTAGGDTFIHQLLEMAGGENIAADVEGWGYSFEKIVEEDPDILICSAFWDAKKGLEESDGYKDLRAVREGALYAFDNNTVDRQGPRLAEGLRNLAEIIHPELF